MSIRVFGVTAATLRLHMFPQVQPFTANTRPTDTIVLEKVKDGAADLAGRLLREGVAAATVEDSVTYPNAYQWCSKYIRLYAAIGVLQGMVTQDPEVLKAWRADLAQMREDLDELGYQVLGDAPAPETDANGPLTHVEHLGLETPEDDEASDVRPMFRRSDVL